MATQKLNKTYVGTELKMHIGFDYPGSNINLNNIDFEVLYYTDENEDGLSFQKSNLIHEGTEWYAPVDTTIIGPGVLKMKLTAYIPDSKFDDGIRTEVGKCVTNVIIDE